jgi:prephenate dehydrogenase
VKVGIIGLGLMGGSFALALKRRFKDRDEKLEIIGLDHNDQHCLEALELKIADKITDDITDLFNLDLIVLTIPVNAILKILPELKDVSSDTTIIDFGSTKEKIVDAIPKEIRANFVASHPMTGTEKFGPSAATRKLYRGKVVVLCNKEENAKRHLKFAKDIFRDIGMKIFYMNAKEHDVHAAYISHMPHAVSYALANTVMAQENPKAILALAGGGFKDMSRIAKGSPNMWIDIFKKNKQNLLTAMKEFKKELEQLEDFIEEDNFESAKNWILKANNLHDIL